MAFCKNCGQQLESDSKFCKNCGTEITEKQEGEKIDEVKGNKKLNNNPFIDALLDFFKKHWFGVSLAVELIILFACIICFMSNTFYIWGTTVLAVLGVIAFILFMILLVFIDNAEERKKIIEKCKLIKDAFKELGVGIKKAFNEERLENEIILLFVLGVIDFWSVILVIGF